MSTPVQFSKVEQTRRRQATEYINANLRRKLTDFENDYLNHAANWAVRKLEIEIKEWEEAIAEVDRMERGWEIRIKNHQYRIDQLQRTLQLDAILKMRALTDAKEGYDVKIDKVVELLVREGFNSRFFKIEDIGVAGGNLEFLISNDVKEVHARLIFAHGPIKAPHFRFITTVRQK